MRERTSHSASRDPDGSAKLWAAKLYVENLLSTTEIADVLHVTSPTVSEWLRKMNVRIRTECTLRQRERLREANLGDKRWNWKGGVTPDRVRLRTSLDMKLARECCFERDDYTCRTWSGRPARCENHLQLMSFRSRPDGRSRLAKLGSRYDHQDRP